MAFNPVTDIAWPHCWWAGGPETVASSPTDDTTVEFFYDEKNSVDLRQTDSAKRPKYKASSGPNGKPSWLFDGGDHMPGTISVASAWTIVVVGSMSSADRAVFGNSDASVYIYQNGTDWVMQGGSVYGGHGGHATAIDTNYHLFTAVATATKLAIEVDGVPQRSNQSGESPTTLATIQVGSMHPTYYFCNTHIAFVGIYPGDARDDANWGLFETWAATEYALAVPDATVSPSTIAATVALPAATVITSTNATATPAAIATAVTVPQVTVTAGADRTPGAVATVAALPAPTVTADALVAPTVTATTATLPQVTVTAGADRTPDTITAAAALPSVTVTADALVTPAAVAATVTVPQADPVESTPLTIATAVTVPQATISAGSTVTPA